MVRQTFEQSSVAPPPGVWESVQAGIQPQVPVNTVAIKSGFLKTIGGKIVAALLSASVITATYFAYDTLKSEDKSNPEKSAIITKENSAIGQPENQEMADPGSRTSAVQDQNASSANDKRIKDEQRVERRAIAAKPEVADHPSGQSGSLPDQVAPTFKKDHFTPKVNRSNNFYITPVDSHFCPGDRPKFKVANAAPGSNIVWRMEGITSIPEDANGRSFWLPAVGKFPVRVVIYQDEDSFVLTRTLWVNEPNNQLAFILDNEKGAVLAATGKIQDEYHWKLNGIELPNKGVEIVLGTGENGPEPFVAELETGKGNCRIYRKLNGEIPAKPAEPFIPNVFTPGSKDGVNDCYRIKIDQPLQYHLIIRNKRGNIVFESRDSEECWNGQVNNQGENCLPDIYYYQLMFTSKYSKPQKLTGKIQLF